MTESLGDWKRTHNCGQLRVEDVGTEVTLMGWVSKRRDHGGVIFVDLRDRWGITQVVFRPDLKANTHTTAENIRSEFVIAVKGRVEPRPDGMANPNLPTGQVDIECTDLKLLNASETPPFAIEADTEVNEELRLRYRYLDLRRPNMQEALILRHKAAQQTRQYLVEQDFLEIETPYLMRSTPEGARDYLVPSRVHPGSFYALPQSPQTYKQLLMVAGYDRYFQIVRCFRDEDLRGDRQPEFTQIDIEMSFVDENDVMHLAEGLARHVFEHTIGVQLVNPIPRITHQEAMARFGTDRPDTRFGFEIVDITKAAEASEFQVFKNVISSGGLVRAINATGCGHFSRKQIDDLTAFVATYGAKGLAWIKVTDNGLESSVVKFFPEAAQNLLRESLQAKPGDLLLFVADQPAVVTQALGNLRLELARQQDLLKPGQYSILWVTEFPLLEYDDDSKRFVACHHPFTSPFPEDMGKLETNPATVRSRAYDLVLNGNEIAGGSIRIHQREVQERMFSLLGISPEEANEKFGFLLNAFRYGAPPHGGIAFGYDRLVALLAGKDFIRDVIAFPKTNAASSLMDNAPSEVDPAQLRELGLRIL
jgi:aspartyl-tRNA synthetase